MTVVSTITAVAIHDNAVRVAFSDQPEFIFHAMWLRDLCGCPACVHGESKQKILTAQNITDDLRPKTATIADGGLKIAWPDGHVSRFTAGQLADSTAAGRARRKHHPVLWDRALGEGFPSVTFSQVRDCDAARLEMLKALVDYGTVRVRDVSTDEARTEQLAAMASLIRETPHGRIYDVRTLPKVHNLAYGADGLSLHVDGSYHYHSPGPMLFHFIETTPRGGDTVLADGFQIARRLEAEIPEGFDLLCRLPWRNAYWNAGMDFRASAPAIGIDRDGDLTHVILNQYTSFPDHFDAGEIESAYGAWRQIHEIAGRPEMQVRMKMPAGDALFFDNRRVLHARTAFDPNEGPRRLRSCYMERDTLHSNLRVLARKLGDPMENAIFAAT